MRELSVGVARQLKKVVSDGHGGSDEMSIGPVRRHTETIRDGRGCEVRAANVITRHGAVDGNVEPGVSWWWTWLGAADPSGAYAEHTYKLGGDWTDEERARISDLVRKVSAAQRRGPWMTAGGE